MLQIRSNTSTVPVSQMHIVYSIWMTIADDMSALSERILLIVFVIIPASPSTGIYSGMPFAFQRVRI